MVGTSASPPRMASVYGTSTSTSRSSPFRSKRACGWTVDDEEDIAAPATTDSGPPFARDAHAGTRPDAGGDLYLEAARPDRLAHALAGVADAPDLGPVEEVEGVAEGLEDALVDVVALELAHLAAQGLGPEGEHRVEEVVEELLAQRLALGRARQARQQTLAGAGFELFYQVDYLLPHREAAWVLMEERLRDAAAFAVRCGQQCTPALMQPLARVAKSLEEYADKLQAAS